MWSEAFTAPIVMTRVQPRNNTTWSHFLNNFIQIGKNVDDSEKKLFDSLSKLWLFLYKFPLKPYADYSVARHGDHLHKIPLRSLKNTDSTIFLSRHHAKYDCHWVRLHETSPFTDNFHTLPYRIKKKSLTGSFYADIEWRAKDWRGFHEKVYFYFLKNVENLKTHNVIIAAGTVMRCWMMTANVDNVRMVGYVSVNKYVIQTENNTQIKWSTKKIEQIVFFF